MTSLSYSSHFLKAMAAATVFQLPQRSGADDLHLQQEEALETIAGQHTGTSSIILNPHA